MSDALETTDIAAPAAGNAWLARVLPWVLVAYWFALALGTHLPPRNVPHLGSRGLDKLLHFGAYGGLAFLLASWVLVRSRCRWTAAITVLLVLPTYGILDEVLQLAVGRNAEFADWLADVIGSICGLTFVLLAWTWLTRDTADDSPLAQETHDDRVPAHR